jgi:hypothetical protein
MMRVAFMTKAPVELAYCEGKSKVFKTHLRPINSNPCNNSYIVVGVEDQDNEIVGDFFDDSHIQNLVNAYLENPPKFNMKTSLSKLTKRQSDWISDRKTKK